MTLPLTQPISDAGTAYRALRRGELTLAEFARHIRPYAPETSHEHLRCEQCHDRQPHVVQRGRELCGLCATLERGL